MPTFYVKKSGIAKTHQVGRKHLYTQMPVAEAPLGKASLPTFNAVLLALSAFTQESKLTDSW